MTCPLPLEIEMGEEVDSSTEIVNDVGESELTATERLLQAKRKRPASDVFTSKEDSMEELANKEIDLYLQLQRCDKNEYVLLWWKEHAPMPLRLSILTRMILGILVGSAVSEQVTGYLMQ